VPIFSINGKQVLVVLTSSNSMFRVQSMQIIIFSNDSLLNEVLMDYLTDRGHRVTNFEAFPELNKMLQKNGSEPDLLLIDCNMEHVRKFIPIKQWHQSFPYIPIIFITPISGVLPVDEALTYGVYAYLRKPVSLSELELLLNRIAIDIFPRVNPGS
jgi:DNA-binding NtrC family response regulator